LLINKINITHIKIQNKVIIKMDLERIAEHVETLMENEMHDEIDHIYSYLDEYEIDVIENSIRKRRDPEQRAVIEKHKRERRQLEKWRTDSMQRFRKEAVKELQQIYGKRDISDLEDQLNALIRKKSQRFQEEYNQKYKEMTGRHREELAFLRAFKPGERERVRQFKEKTRK